MIYVKKRKNNYKKDILITNKIIKQIYYKDINFYHIFIFIKGVMQGDDNN